MEIYILDSQLRRSVVIDRFESMIWTERYSAHGDFELVITSTPDTRAQFLAGTRLSMNNSYRVMTVEVVEDKVDSEGRKLLTIKGRSLESILSERTARKTFTDYGESPKWIVTGTPASIARQIFNETCRTNTNNPEDQIPFLVAGSLFPASTIPEPSVSITVELDLQSVYEALTDICDAYNLGFRLVRNFDKSELYFDIYSGSDRTTKQSGVAPVVFSPELDNLADTSEVTAISTYKNVAYVFHPANILTVYAEGITSAISGFQRRAMHVDASDITLPERTYTVTDAQAEAIKIATDSVDDKSDADIAVNASLQKLTDKKRLFQVDIDVINSFVAVGSTVLTGPQKNELDVAKTTNMDWSTKESTDILPELFQRGEAELAKNRSVYAFDGELPANNPYKYELSYQLGDLVEMRNTDGVANRMRVTEQIFVSDHEGERAYPTLKLDLFITPGSWMAWDYTEEWVAADETWAQA